VVKYLARLQGASLHHLKVPVCCTGIVTYSHCIIHMYASMFMREEKWWKICFHVECAFVNSYSYTLADTYARVTHCSSMQCHHCCAHAVYSPAACFGALRILFSSTMCSCYLVYVARVLLSRLLTVRSLILPPTLKRSNILLHWVAAFGQLVCRASNSLFVWERDRETRWNRAYV
jgi:hypothetical protein